MSRSETLEQLEGKNWTEPTFDSFLVGRIHALRRKPIADFTVEDLRIAIGQQVGLNHLLPLALDRLDHDPFSEGDFYPGDLLCAVLEVGSEYWSAHHREANRIATVADRVKQALGEHSGSVEIKARLRTLIDARPWRAA